MNIVKEFTRYKRNLNIKRNFGYVFVDDKNDYESIKNQITLFNHFEQYTNWYLPFDRATYFSNVSEFEKDIFTAVTFIDNPEHSFYSKINFSIYLTENFLVYGNLQIMKVEDYSHEFHEEYQRTHTDRLSMAARIRIADEDYNYIAFITLTKGILKLSGKEHEIPINTQTQMRFDKSGIFKRVTSHVTRAFIYFTQFIIDTKLFVVEEKPMKQTRKGIKECGSYDSVYRIIDIKKIRSSYIKPDSNKGNGSDRVVKVGHERRRHTRTFRSDYYKNKQGETIVIEPTWVGPTEYFDKPLNKLYKVRLDIG